MAENRRKPIGPGVGSALRSAAGRTFVYGVSVTEVTSHASLSTVMSSTTAVTVQSTAWVPSDFGTHFTTNAVPSTAAVVPPAFTSNDPVSETLAARFHVSPTESVPWVWRPPSRW